MRAEEIREMRERLGLTQEKLAHVLGVSFGTINRWENSVCIPSPLAMERLKQLEKKKGSDERSAVCEQ